jgi:cephalosporin-C deacetylase
MRRNFRPTPTRPRDFDAFWESTLRALEGTDPEVERDPLPEAAPPGLIGERVSFRSLGGARVSAYFVRWADDTPRPLVVYSHGYACQCAPRWEWAARGVNALGVDVRGFGISTDALPRRSRWGFVLTGIEAPETSALRGAVCDYVQAARVARLLTEGRRSRTVLHGVSFAGGLALMSEALLGVSDLLAVGVPTFGWTAGRQVFVRIGSGAEVNAYLAARPDHLEDVMLVLSYFDTVNFADRVRCPALVGVGLKDEVVPAKTVYGIANHLAGPVQVMEFPVSHSDHPDEQLWERFERYWLELAVDGVPASFGDPPAER